MCTCVCDARCTFIVCILSPLISRQPRDGAVSRAARPQKKHKPGVSVVMCMRIRDAVEREMHASEISHAKSISVFINWLVKLATDTPKLWPLGEWVGCQEVATQHPMPLNVLAFHFEERWRGHGEKEYLWSWWEKVTGFFDILMRRILRLITFSVAPSS